MGAFFFEYGLFAVKVITLIIALVAGIAALVFLISSRHPETENIEIEKINDKFDNLRDALESEILSKEELKQLKKERKKEEKEKAKEEKRKSKTENAPTPTRNRVFVLRFVGDLHASEVDNMRESISAILTVAKPEDEVLIILDSPGGLVHSYGLAASQLKRIRNHGIKLTAAVDLIAASGGYLMAAVANKIIAAPFAVVGSIGVIAQLPNFHRLLDKHNIDIEQHTAGEYKATLTMLGKNTDKDRKKFIEELEDTHTLFKQYVSENRPQLDMHKIATGEHWYGAQAISLNLIDEIMTSDDFLMNKSKNSDIFEVNYTISESFSDKFAHFVDNLTKKSMRSLSNWMNRNSLV